jgi:hypothetical protein
MKSRRSVFWISAGVMERLYLEAVAARRLHMPKLAGQVSDTLHQSTTR